MTAASNSPSVITQLLTAAGVTRVVFVDDRFGVTSSRIQSMVDDLSTEKLSESGAFTGVDFSSDDEDIIRGKVTELVSTADKSKLDKIFEMIVAVEHPEHDETRDKDAAGYFHTIVSSAAEIIVLSLMEWKRHSSRLLREAAENPTIFIFDDDFTLEGESDTYGRRLVSETHAANINYRFVYALLTHNAPDEAAEETLEAQIAADMPDLEDYLIVISKNRLSEQSTRFADRMKTFFLSRFFKVLTKRLIEEIGSASERAVEQVRHLGIHSFENIILGSSRAEGAWSPDTLVRVIGVYQQQIVKSSIRKDEELHRLVREISPICDVVTAEMSDAVPANASRLQHDEIYEAGETVNAVHLPISSGDVFTDAQGTQYIVLAQPCDLMVRGNGLRKSEQKDRQQLVALAVIRKVGRQFKEGPTPGYLYELPHFVEGERWSVCMNETFHLPLWLLDLGVCSSEGRCRISANDTPSPLLIEPWVKRHPTLLERAEAVARSVGEMSDTSVEREVVIQSWCRIPLGSPFRVEVEGDKDEWRLDLQMTRTLRTAESHATGILIEYTAFQSRLAHPHDLARLAKTARSGQGPSK